MRVAIFGKGVTGTATGAVFSRAGFEVEYEDPPKGCYPPDGFQPDFVFLCVPTPTGNLKHVIAAMMAAGTKFPQAPVVVRSTIPPGTVKHLRSTFQRDVILMPEFLREQYALEDALRCDKAVYATHNERYAEDFAVFLAKAGYQEARRVSVEACELVKIALNAMLAVKVAFANVLYDVAKANEANYDEVVELMLMDGWLSRFGLQVPGRHGRGYSGTCLPKDLGWLVHSLLDTEGDLTAGQWLQAVQAYNTFLRTNTTEAPREVMKEVA